MIESLRHEIPVVFLCRYFGVSTSGYYTWKNRPPSSPAKIRKQKVCEKIKAVFADSKGTYGSPRVYHELKSQGVSVCENTVARYMNEMGLNARLKKKFRVATTNSNHDGPIADRIFKSEEPLPDKPREVLAGDITYLHLGGSFLYLAVVMDLYNREILGWSMSLSLESQIVVKALEMALAKCHPETKITFHSDRGSQYASQVFLKLLNDKQVNPSMSRKGNCYDNCYVESWFKSLKDESIRRNQYTNEEELRALVFEYIETWYNTKRRHSSLGYMSPIEYKTKTS